HHIKPLGSPHDGPDVRENILCVCPNHHVMLDYGVIELDGVQLPGIGREYINYHNEHIFGKK
ncbi:MAG: HNH endonuclease, partial [Deltaproteobacteria bacterium]|nr:HNH endonuclease [Deltaproteobacteria bacterium]